MGTVENEEIWGSSSRVVLGAAKRRENKQK